MANWKPSKKDLKQYPHFDAPVSLKELERIANSPKRVAENNFFPFLKYKQSHRPFRPSGEERKDREIRFAGRCDAAIFSRYRHELSEKYERVLSASGVGESVLAYRSIPVSPGMSYGKCNIHHAKDAFDKISSLESCCVLTLDISKFFENVDHTRIRDIWCRLLEVSHLPKDHFKVFKAITKYSVVDLKEAYKALGYFGTKPSGIEGYLIPKNEMPKQLCTPQEFREKICGKLPNYPMLIEKNKNPHGIPQGAPLSDLLANAYLLNFDKEMSNSALALGGFYMRYSDDILFVLPVGEPLALQFMKIVRERICAYGQRLRIKESKCTIDRFVHGRDGLKHVAVFPTGVARNGLEYLGFRFDGKRVYLRDSTLSGFRRKINKAINSETRNLVARFPGKNISFLKEQLDTDALIRQFGRVKDFEPSLDKRSWTFWTYVKRASDTFGPKSRINKQVATYRQDIRDLADRSLADYAAKAAKVGSEHGSRVVGEAGLEPATRPL